MATQYSNKPIVTDGLVYALDFGNPKSYVSGSSVARSLNFVPYVSTLVTFSGAPIPTLTPNGIQFTNNFTVDTGNPFSVVSDSRAFTMMYTVRVAGNGLFTTKDNGNQSSLHSVLNTNLSVVGWRYYNANIFNQRQYSFTPSTINHHTWTYSSGSYTYYINGIPVTGSDSATGGGVSLTWNLYLSGRSAAPDQFWSGSLFNFYLYDRVLTADEIYSNYLITAQRIGLSTRPKPYTVDPDVYNFLTATNITDGIITSSLDTFVRGLKSASLWDKMIAIYPFVGTGSVGTNLTGSHRWNLKEATVLTSSFNGSWNGSTSGSTPSGSNTFISVPLSPTRPTLGSWTYPNYSSSNVHISILSYDTPVSRSYLMGTGMTEDLAASTLAGDYGTPAAAYSVRKVRTAYTGALMDVRRSIDNVTSSIGFVSNGDLDTGSLLDWVVPGRSTLPGAYSGLAAAYSLRRVSASYSGNAIRVRGDIENQFRDIGFDASGNLDTGSLLYFTATGSNTLAGSYSGIAAAYSLRKVVPGYSGYVIEVRTGTVSQSIGFDSFGNLDTGSLLTFAGGSSAFIKTWYDQSGNNRHATQSVDAQQPRIVNNGLLVTQSGRPALDFNGSYDMVTTPFPLSSTDGLLLISVDKPSVATANKIYTYDTTAGQYWNTGGLLFSQQEFRVDGSSKINLSVSPETLDYKVRTYYATSTNAFMSINGRIAASSSYSSFSIPSPVNAFIGRASGGGAERYVGLLQELIFYSASQATNKNYIESNINAYYNVFTTSSVSTENAFVNTWYDQSGNNRHATQTSTGSQPLIVSSGSLIRDLGNYPSILFQASRETNLNASSASIPQDSNFAIVSLTDSITNTTVAYQGFRSSGFNILYLYPTLFGSTTSRFNYRSPELAGGSFDVTSPSSLRVLNTAYRSGTTFGITRNGNLNTTTQTISENMATFYIGNSGSDHFNGRFTELLIYHSDQSANRPLIENNINNYYNIYTGSNHGFVARWYDQSGNNRHATQTATGSQPVIVLSGSTVVENGRPSLKFDGVDDKLQTAAFTNLSIPYTTFLVNEHTNFPAFPYIVDHASQRGIIGTVGTTRRIFNGSTLNYGDSSIGLFELNYGLFDGASSQAAVNGGTVSVGNTGTSTFYTITFGAQGGSTVGDGTYFSGYMWEYTGYNLNQSSNRGPIEYNINNYYNIYPQTSSFATSSFAIYTTSGSVSASLNNDLISGISTSGPLGLITVSRTGSNSLTIARNGVTTSFAVPASGALSTGIYLGAINNNGLALGNSPLGISFASVGTGLSNSETVTLNGLIGGLQGNLFSDTDATAFIQAAGLTGSFLDDIRIPSAISYLTQNLKRYGLWSKMRAIYPFVGNSSNSQRINLKNPSLYPLNYGSGYTFSTQNGSVPGATITGFNMGVDASTLLSPNSGSIGFYTPTNVTRSGWTFGNTQFSLVIALYGADTQVYYNYSNTTGISRTPVRGFYAMSKTGSFVEGFYNSSRIYSGSQSTGSINGTLTFGTGQGTTSDAAFTFGYVADSLTTSEVQNLYGIVQTYQTILGRQV
jgi:hypothetical protein